MVMAIGLFLWLLVLALSHLTRPVRPVDTAGKLLKASCNIQGKDVRGLLLFVARGDLVVIRGLIDGLEPGKHGLTINESGNITENCDAVGGHLNPEGKEHGSSTSENSHLGDLGNVDASDDLIVDVHITSTRIRLSGNRSVMSRSCVIYKLPDDYGTKDDGNSKSTGDMGEPVGCGLIKAYSMQGSAKTATLPSPLFVSLLWALVFASFLLRLL